MKNKFQLKREATYAKLIQAGFEVLCKKGYSGASVDDIVEHAGYTKGAFYVHFESKEQFMLDLIAYRKARRAENFSLLVQLIETVSSLEQIVKQSMEIITEQLKQNPEWILVYVDFFVQAKSNEQSRKVYQSLYDQWVGEIQQFIEMLKSKQFLPQDIDTLEKSKMFYAYLDGCLLHFNFYQDMLNAPLATKVFLAIVKD